MVAEMTFGKHNGGSNETTWVVQTTMVALTPY